jgi:acyl-coenzyme A thioesterase PaaI-like protein
MSASSEALSEDELRSFLFGLSFVREYSISLVSVAPGAVTIDLPFNERLSGPPSLFPASMVGTAGDVAAVTSCLSLLPKGWGLATLDFTIKMTGFAGRALQSGRTNSIGAAEVFVISGGEERLCGTLLATTRNFEIKS